MKEKIYEWANSFGYEINETWENKRVCGITIKSITIGKASLDFLEKMGINVISVDIPFKFDVNNPMLEIWVMAEKKGE